MNRVLFVFLSLSLAVLLLSLGCVNGGGHRGPDPAEMAHNEAYYWFETSPTYAFDGIRGPDIGIGVTYRNLLDGCYESTFYYQSSHAGYGNRSGQMLAQVITDHNTTIHVCNGTVTWANTDGVYDEIHQTDICMMLSAVITVCGADNQTYQHPCFAKAKGVAIAHDGACESNTSAPGGPSACYDIYLPVCGADNHTYSNDCFAGLSNVSIAYTGACAPARPPRGTEGGFCGGIAGFQCQDGLTCRLDGNYPDAGGTCIKPGEDIVCTTEYAPVCGMDNRTYSNLCFARAARVSILHDGECNVSAGIANPASVYCTKSGGALEIKKDASGGEAGYCTLVNGTICEEWALYRGECGLVSDTCQNDSDCGYAWFTGACHNPAWVQQRQELAANQGLLLGEAPPRENVTCTCGNKICITHG